MGIVMKSKDDNLCFTYVLYPVVLGLYWAGTNIMAMV